MERYFDNKIILEYGKFIMKHVNLIEELKKWQYELNAGDPKITKIDNVIIRLERVYLNSNKMLWNKIESGS